MARLLLLLLCLWSGTVLAGSKLTSTPSDAWHLLGDSISVSGNTAAIAANGTGQVYIREYQAGTGWVTTKVIGTVGPVIGGIVRLTTNHLAVSRSGKLLMYGRNQGGTGNWGLEQQLTISLQGLGVVDGDRMLVTGSNSTSEYQWSSGTGLWTFVSSFGTQPPLALSGNTAVLGLPSSSNFSTTLSVFERNVAGTWTQTATVSPTAPVDHDYFGEAVALDGNWLIVGAPAWFSTSSDHGAAYVYQRNQGGANAWGAVQSLTPIGSVVEFGTSVSISGTRVAVGMEEADSTVHVFERTGSTYSLKGRFRPGVNSSDNFGRVLGLAGDQLIASDLWRGTPNNEAGAIFQFDVTTGQTGTIATENGIFVSDPESVGDSFGASVAMDGQTLAIGAPMTDNPMSDGGSVSIYSRQSDGTWALAKTLVPADAGIQNYFGVALALQGDTLAVSASGNQAIYIFDRNTGGAGQWGQITKLTSRYVLDFSLDGDTLAGTSSAAGSVYLLERNSGGANHWGATTLSSNGSQVSLSGNILVSSGNSSAATVEIRSALGATDWHFSANFSTPFPFYIFGASSLDGDTVAIAGVDSMSGQSRPPEIVSIRQRNQGGANTWGEVARLSPFDRTGEISYGTDVKLKGTRLVVGAPGDTTAGTAAGSVYVYEGSADKTSWTLIRKMSAFDPLAGDLFGTSVGTNGDDVAGGAPGHSGAGTGAGAAYVSSTQSHLNDWMALNAPGVTGDPKTVDTNGDGLSLYAEYAMGLSAAGMNVAVTPLTNPGSGNCTFDYSLSKDAPDVLTTVQWSTDLHTWRALGDGLSFSSTLLSETRDAWRYRATIPTGSQPNLFLRLSFAPGP